jgi:hypothetical protein
VAPFYVLYKGFSELSTGGFRRHGVNLFIR